MVSGMMHSFSVEHASKRGPPSSQFHRRAFYTCFHRFVNPCKCQNKWLSRTLDTAGEPSQSRGLLAATRLALMSQEKGVANSVSLWNNLYKDQFY
jgi:hypothetical protein